MNGARLVRANLARASLSCLLVAAGAAIAAGYRADPGAPAESDPGPIARQAAPDDEILVTGDRQGREDSIHAFVGTLLAETENGRVARWSGRICLNVEGGSRELGQYFGHRIADVADGLGLEILFGRRCEPSAYIIFTRAPELLLERLAEERPAFYGSISPAQRERFLASDDPVRWVSHAQLRAANGEAPGGFYVEPKKGGTGRPVPSMRGVTPSRLALGSRMDLGSLLVVVDASRLDGISNRSLSAYLAMVVLGNLRQDHADIRQPSILHIFKAPRRDAELITADLSDWDLAYLRSLYQGNWNLSSEERVRRIRASMARNLEADRADSPPRP